jgi:hypothetical protein
MRAAIQISGEFRCLHLTLDSFQKYILNDLQAKGYNEICIFCHCWEKEKTELGTFPFEGRGNWHKTIPVFSTQEGLRIFNPICYMIEKLEDVKVLEGRSRILCMYYSIFVVNKLREQFESQHNVQFDLVIRYRTDLVLESNLLEDKPDISSYLVIPKSTIVATCDAPFESTDESHICDYIAYGTPDKMNIYTSVFETWVNIPETPIGESCLAMHLKLQGVKAIRKPLPFYLVEGNGTKRGVVKQSDFTISENTSSK